MWCRAISATPRQNKHRRLASTGFCLAISTLAVVLSTASDIASWVAPIAALRAPGAVRGDSGPDLIVLSLDDTDLSDLQENPKSRGRQWERPGHVSILSDAGLQFESAVGVRVHGGVSRWIGTTQRSYRLYFRDGLNSGPEGVHPSGSILGFTGNREHKIVVLHGDERSRGESGEWHYLNPLVYEIAQRVGIMTAETHPISAVINGAPPRPYVLTEHLDMDYLASRFGHTDFTFFNTRNRADVPLDDGPIAELHKRFGSEKNWSLAKVKEVVDVDNLSKWLATMLFCGSRDAWQGLLVRDRSHTDSKWFWIAWDFDQSFGFTQEGPLLDANVDQFEAILGPKPHGWDPDARVALLRHLLGTSEEFRRDFANTFIDLRDRVLTPEFLDSVLSKYERVAETSGVTDTRYQVRIRDFLNRRPAIVREQLIQKFHVDIPQGAM